MTVTLAATIRDYNSSSDSCTVELAAAGAIDSWIDGVGIASSIDRHLLAPGALATLAMPDTHRICEAQVVQVSPSLGAGTYVPVYNPQSGLQRRQDGVFRTQADSGGHVSVAVTFPVAFSAAPVVHFLGMSGTQWSVTNVTTTGFTAALSVTVTPYAWVIATWYAIGNQ